MVFELYKKLKLPKAVCGTGVRLLFTRMLLFVAVNFIVPPNVPLSTFKFVAVPFTLETYEELGGIVRFVRPEPSPMNEPAEITGWPLVKAPG